MIIGVRMESASDFWPGFGTRQIIENYSRPRRGGWVFWMLVMFSIFYERSRRVKDVIRSGGIIILREKRIYWYALGTSPTTDRPHFPTRARLFPMSHIIFIVRESSIYKTDGNVMLL